MNCCRFLMDIRATYSSSRCTIIIGTIGGPGRYDFACARAVLVVTVVVRL
jgi:hypothetical protein